MDSKEILLPLKLEIRVKSEIVEPVKVEPDDGNTGMNQSLGAQSSSAEKGKRKLKDAHSPNSVKKVKKDEDETSAHLHPLQDHLLHGLNVVFCGINPGRMSAETGHHYANPTNHFWRCLHRSGMTTALIPPSEDFSLPETFNIGLTNLIDQSSTQARELSRAQMIAAVPAFLDKLARYRPRFVCFVGVVIWEIVRNSFAKLFPQEGSAKNKGKKNKMGLQPYKLVWENTKAGFPQETLIFVVPSTSGRVVQYQLPDKIVLFTELHKLIKMRGSEIDTSIMKSIDWHSD